MTTRTTTLAAWLLEQIAADEAVAEEVQRYLIPGAVIDVLLTRHEGDESYTKTMRPYDPAHVLRLCSALRAIVELHAYMQGHESRDFGFENGNCWECRKQGPCATLRNLAAAFADRPGFDEEWLA